MEWFVFNCDKTEFAEAHRVLIMHQEVSKLIRCKFRFLKIPLYIYYTFKKM